MTLPFGSVPPYLTSLSTLPKKRLLKEQSDFLKTVRMLLKARIVHSRSKLMTTWIGGYPRLISLPICAICDKPKEDLSMHEWLITRGDASGAPFEEFMQIFVPCNVVLVCEPVCHNLAQWKDGGKLKCLANIKQYHAFDETVAWLLSLPSLWGYPQEMIRWLEERWDE
jgi:hypothetical protein